MYLTRFKLEPSYVLYECGRLGPTVFTQLNSTGHVTLMAKRDQKREKKATAYQYPLSLI